MSIPNPLPLAASSAGTPLEKLFEVDFLKSLGSHGLVLFWNVVAATLVLLAGHWFGKVLSALVQRALERGGIEVTVRKFLGRLIYGFVLTVAVLAVLNLFGVETTALVAAVGAAAMAVGLALQGSLSNFAAGAMLVVLRPFHVDDEIECGGILGTVEEIGLFSTSVRSGDNRVAIVPNSAFISQPVTNNTAKPERRVDIVVGVSYSDNLQTAREIALRVLAEEPRVLKVPAPSVFVAALADSSVNLAIRPWVKTKDFYAARAALIEKLKIALEAGGCSIPFPQHDVHVIPQPEGAK
jgi:small conductance mechanosensitive channel